MRWPECMVCMLKVCFNSWYHMACRRTSRSDLWNKIKIPNQDPWIRSCNVSSKTKKNLKKLETSSTRFVFLFSKRILKGFYVCNLDLSVTGPNIESTNKCCWLCLQFLLIYIYFIEIIWLTSFPIFSLHLQCYFMPLTSGCQKACISVPGSYPAFCKPQFRSCFPGGLFISIYFTYGKSSSTLLCF